MCIRDSVNRKKKKDGSRYKDYFYYTCKHRRSVDGHVCTYKKQWGEDKVNAAVAEVIKKLVQNPKFEAAIRQKINTRIDTGELEQEIENLRKQLRQVLGAKKDVYKRQGYQPQQHLCRSQTHRVEIDLLLQDTP